MNYAIITDLDAKTITFGTIDKIRLTPHSANSMIDFLKTEFQTYYAANLIFLQNPEFIIRENPTKMVL